MMSIRKRGETWEVRYLGCNGHTWNARDNLEDVQQTIINTVVNLNHYSKFALEVMSGQSEIYLYQDGKLIRRKPLGKVFCLTQYLQERAHIETIIYMIESGVWRVREWKTPECLAHFPKDTWLPDGEKIEKSYLILETIDNAFMPSDIEFIDTDLLKLRV